jgi:hypothetical protein
MPSKNFAWHGSESIGKNGWQYERSNKIDIGDGPRFTWRCRLQPVIVDNLKREKPSIPGQHQLLLGLWGMGKTTLLRRIALAIKQDEQLNAIWLPLSFPE